MSIGINDALSKLYLKLGGNPQDIRENKSITDYIDDLGDVLKSLAELPGVSSSDNGKILKVIDGTWAKGDAPTELPAVTSSDNGKILKVSNGIWSKGEDSSYSPMTFQVNQDSEGSSGISGASDLSYNMTRNYLTKQIFLNVNDASGEMPPNQYFPSGITNIPLDHVDYDSNMPVFVFKVIGNTKPDGSGTDKIATIRINSKNNNIKLSMHTLS